MLREGRFFADSYAVVNLTFSRTPASSSSGISLQTSLSENDGIWNVSGSIDLVILCRRGQAEEALTRMRELMRKLKLTVNEDKTRICKVPEGSFEFLGYTFGQLYTRTTGNAYVGMRPSKKSLRHMIETVHALTVEARAWQETTTLVDQLNRRLRGWANYFEVGSVSKAYRAIDSYTTMRLSRWLRNKHKNRRRGPGGYPPSYLYETLGLVRLANLKCGGSWAKA